MELGEEFNRSIDSEARLPVRGAPPVPRASSVPPDPSTIRRSRRAG